MNDPEEEKELERDTELVGVMHLKARKYHKYNPQGSQDM